MSHAIFLISSFVLKLLWEGAIENKRERQTEMLLEPVTLDHITYVLD